MKKSLEYYISELLYLEDCIIVPDFGGFIVNDSSATINKKSGEITPPSKTILFNSQLFNNDGLLVNHIAKEENISHKECLAYVLTISKKLKSKLFETKILRIKQVGLFTIGSENNILFTQEKRYNYNLNSFGMCSINSNTIDKKERIKNEIQNTVNVFEKNIISSNQMFLRAAAVAIPLILISFISINQEQNITTIYEKMSLIDFSFNKTNNKKSLEKDDKASINTTVLPTINTELKYHIIIGSFQEAKNAKKLHTKLLSKKYDAQILSNSLNSRVSISNFDRKEDAILCLKNVKKSYGSAWILTQEQ
tara:strand:- start:482 stop:1405 length:924 start_codon:yes stop_codon:yes gene_type:complete